MVLIVKNTVAPTINARPSTPPTTPPTMAPVEVPPLEVTGVADADVDVAAAAESEEIDDDVVEEVKKIAVAGRADMSVLPAPAGSHISML
jgi:hypothetical protein